MFMFQGLSLRMKYCYWDFSVKDNGPEIGAHVMLYFFFKNNEENEPKPDKMMSFQKLSFVSNINFSSYEWDIVGLHSKLQF